MGMYHLLIKNLPTLEEQKASAQKIFDTSKFDKKNLTTALGKVFCQGGASIDRANSQLGSIYRECLDLKLIVSSNFLFNLFSETKKEKSEASDQAVKKSGGFFGLFGSVEKNESDEDASDLENEKILEDSEVYVAISDKQL